MAASTKKKQATKPKQEGKEKKVGKAPETLFQLLVHIVKGVFKSIPKMLIKVGIIAAVAFVIHTYLVIYPNGGFASMGTRLSSILELKKSGGSGAVIWTVMSGTLFASFALIKNKGVGSFLKGIGTVPVRVVKAIDKKKGFAMALLIAVAFFLSYYWLMNDMMTLVFAIALFLSAAAFRGSFTYVVMRLGHSDFNRMFKREGKYFKEEVHVILMMALCIGFLLYTLLPKSFFSVFIVAAIVVGVGVLAFVKKENRTKAAMFIFGINFLSLFSYGVFGDDGGVAEAGGFINWIGSQGSGTAVTLGLPPAIGSGLGGLLGWGLGNGINDMFSGPFIPPLEDPFPDMPEMEDLLDPDILADTAEGMANDIADAAGTIQMGITGAGQTLGVPLAGDVIEETIEETVEDIGNLVDDLTNPDIISDTIDGSMEDIGDMMDTAGEMYDDAVETAGDMYDSAAEMLGDGAEAVGNGLDILEDTWDMSVEDFGNIMEALMDPDMRNEALAGTYDDISDLVSDIYNDPNIMWETIRDSAGDMGSMIRDGSTTVGDFVTGIQDGILTSDAVDSLVESFGGYIPDWMVKDDSVAGDAWDFLGNVLGVADELGFIPEDSIVGQIGTPAGMIKDMLQNIGAGDNAVYGGIKSIASNLVKNGVNDANYPVKMMEMFSNIFFGGTGADNIINPGKTIQGSANYIIDSIADWVNGTNDVASRVDSGHYGGFYQTMDQAFEEAADYVYDNTGFTDRLMENYTIGEFFDDVRTNNSNLWRVNENSLTTKFFDTLANAPGPPNIFQVVNNRNACALGEKIFEGLSYVGEGVTHTGKFLGETAADGVEVLENIQRHYNNGTLTDAIAETMDPGKIYDSVSNTMSNAADTVSDGIEIAGIMADNMATDLGNLASTAANKLNPLNWYKKLW